MIGQKKSGFRYKLLVGSSFFFKYFTDSSSKEICYKSPHQRRWLKSSYTQILNCLLRFLSWGHIFWITDTRFCELKTKIVTRIQTNFPNKLLYVDILVMAMLSIHVLWTKVQNGDKDFNRYNGIISTANNNGDDKAPWKIALLITPPPTHTLVFLLTSISSQHFFKALMMKMTISSENLKSFDTYPQAKQHNKIYQW